MVTWEFRENDAASYVCDECVYQLLTADCIHKRDIMICLSIINGFTFESTKDLKRREVYFYLYDLPLKKKDNTKIDTMYIKR